MGCVNIFVFIAGAIRMGILVAAEIVVRMLSAMPDASLAMVFAVAGAMTRMSPRSAREI